MTGVFFIVVIIALAFGFAGGSIWSNKGGSFGAGFAIGFFLGVIGLIIVAVVAPSGSGGGTARSTPRASALGPNVPTVEPDGSLSCQRCGRLNQAGRKECIGCGSHFRLPYVPPAPPASPASSPPSPPSEFDLTAELERLAALHTDGKLTQQEFDGAKAKLLSR